MKKIVPLCRKIVKSPDFHRFIFSLILLSALALGMEAVPALTADFDTPLFYFDIFIQAAFVCEMAIRLAACAPRVTTFFRDRWNLFDFTVVALSLIPAIGPFALIARLLRLLRLLRFVSGSEKLRRVADRLHDAFGEIAAAGLVALVFGYIFMISGYYLFADIDPAHWGGLGEALLSVFYLSLFQDVKSFADPLVAQSLFYLLYFVLFYAALLGLILSVVVAAILHSHEQKK